MPSPARLLLSFALLTSCSQIASAQDLADLYPQVQDLLQKHCIECHGPTKQQSGLRLDAGKLILSGGDSGAAINLAAPDKSLLLEAVLGTGSISQMPLEADPLSADEITLLTNWIKTGAKFPENEVIRPAERLTSDHWSFQPIQNPVPPRIPEPAQDWAISPIDAFIASRLADEGLSPSPEAERTTLIRRVSLDLIGLLPSPEEVEAFHADAQPGAYERLVDRLLASPHYGERWGRHWLDAARYGDSNGFTIDGPRDVWKYRDWVVEAINRDLPFDLFTVEQLAGDLLPNPTTDQLVATGFHRNTLSNQEGGTDDEQFRNENIVDRVNTTGTVWMGLTIGCSQCHDHKYDPLPQRDYYRLFAILNNTEDNNDANNLAPRLAIPSTEQAEKQKQLKEQLATAQQAMKTREQELAPQQAEWEKTLAAIPSIDWTVIDPLELSAIGGTALTELDDHSVLASGTIPNEERYRVKFKSPLPLVTAFKLETLTHDQLPKKGPGLAANGNFVLTEVKVLTPKTPEGATWKSATADHSQDDYPVEDLIDGDQETGWAINVNKGNMNVDREAKLALKEPLDAAPDDAWEFLLEHYSFKNQRYLVGRFRISVTDADLSLPTVDPALRTVLAIAESERTDEQKQQLKQAHLHSDPTWREASEHVQSSKQQLTALDKVIPTTLVMKELDKPRESYIHIRGDFLSKGATVTPGTPTVLPALEGVQSPNRLDLAKWLVSAEHPLTARVTVNRSWQRFFGKGLVETENDFGIQGSQPTHPGLLDWLASRLISHNWSMKELHRDIVTSATYRQSSHQRNEVDEIDPRNLLLARQNRIRLDAEIIRDAALSASGLLSSKLNGRPVYPPQPEGIYVLTQSRKDWPESQGEDRYRRSLYTYFWRSSPHPMLPTFDAPDANITCTRRTRSNTPLQALTLANDRGLVEIAAGLAYRVLDEGPDYDEGKLQFAAELCFSRSLNDAESRRLMESLQSQRTYFAEHPEEAKSIAEMLKGTKDYIDSNETAAWTAISRVLLNVDEFVTRE